ncbi:DUF4446 family protein [Salinithrix halophila]|uniref:DUF4446 family protein n=1 Tax=Salinithrix halophila TaxID=1485204 RepID=A0ABV8JJR6_9BACL
MEYVYKMLNLYTSEVILGCVGIQVGLLLLWITAQIRLGRQKRAICSLTEKLGDGDRLKSLLESEEVDGEKLITYLRGLNENLEQLKGRIGLVRYNAMGERATEMSFSLAILDEGKDGVVISSLFSNQGQSYIYAKPVAKGESSYRLSKEEEKAIDQALKPTVEPEEEPAQV